MGDPRFLNKKHITANDICNYLLSECTGFNGVTPTGRHFEDEPYDYHHDDNGYRYHMDKKRNDDDELRELQEAQQREWDAQREYEERMHDIHDRYPGFDADGAIFRHEDPDEAERGARLDDYLNWY